LACVLPKRDISKLFEIDCPGCVNNLSKQGCTNEQTELLSRLHELRKYIISLTQANQILHFLCEVLVNILYCIRLTYQLFVQKRESEKHHLMNELETFHCRESFVRDCLSNFNINPCDNVEKIVSEKTTSESDSRTALNDSNQSDSTGSDNARSLIKELDPVEGSLCSDSNET